MRHKWQFLAGSAGALAAFLIAPLAARAWEQFEDARRQVWIADATAALERGDETLPPLPWGLSFQQHEGVEMDDPGIRRLFNLLQNGPRTPEYQAELLRIAAAETAKAQALATSAKAMPVPAEGFAPALPATTPATTLAWNSLGPAAARRQFNGSYYSGMDSGRLTAIRVDPTDANTVYLATSGGGVWKATNFHTGAPNWAPLTDTIGALAIGAMDIDPTNHLVVYIGTGDAFDQTGGSILKSVDGGVTWGPPVLVTGTHPLFGGFTLTASSIRAIAADPNAAGTVLVTTNVGLFRSVDGGVSFSVVDLPNPAAYNWSTGAVALESTWDLVYLGAVSGVSQWMVSGVTACPGFFPPGPGVGTSPCGASASSGVPAPAAGNVGDVWKFDGTSWSSMRVAGLLPTQDPTWGTTADSTALGDVGRIALGGTPGAGGDPTTATVYGEAGSTKESVGKTVLLFNTTNGGTSWSKLGTPLSTNLTNPTSGTDCATLDAGHAQSYYNLAVGVDPGNPARALVGGNLCAVRTIDGGATWQNVSHWLPSSGQGNTTDGAGALPYVHADWHTITVSRTGGRFVILAGSDGGIFSSYSAFDATPTQLAAWAFPDYGLVTHLAYSHASGDPTLGNAQVLYAGFQDNGTRWRLSQTENVLVNTLRTFDQIIGGDGTGATIASDSNGQNAVYWGSAQTRRRFCRPSARDCSVSTRIIDGTEVGNWVNATIPALPAGDGEPFVERFSPTFDATSSVITATNANVWKITVDASDVVTYTRLTPSGVGGRGIQNQMVHASPWTYLINNVPTRIYGAVTSGGRFGILADTGTGTPALAIATNGMKGPAASGQSLLGSSTVAFPQHPATDPRLTYVGASLATTTSTGAAVLPATGHIFKTTDGGLTWTPIHGNGTPAAGGIGTMDLPNIPIYVVRYDYGDPTDLSLYAGTELGLYRTTDGGNTWVRYGNLPAVRITDITVALNGSLVRVSTYGRGLWEIYPHSEAAAVAGLGDFDQNGVIDFLDLAALASRIGTAPATAAAPPIPPVPLYDSMVDLTGSPTAVEDSDLSALLTKFGSTP